MSQLYNNIRKYRLQRGLTQEELAEKMGYRSKSTIAKIESGKNDIPQSKIKAFADVLSVSVGDLMGWDSPNPPLPSNILPLEQPECILIQKYRRLTDNGRATVDNVIDGLLEAGQPAHEQEQKEPEKIVLPIAARNGTGKQLELTPDELRQLEQFAANLPDEDLSGII